MHFLNEMQWNTVVFVNLDLVHMVEIGIFEFPQISVPHKYLNHCFLTLSLTKASLCPLSQ